MEDVCLVLGDQQLVTGASILIVCYSTHETISQYHFAIGATLSYASFATFGSISIIAVRSFRENTLRKSWRFIWFVLITVAAMLASFVSFENEFLRPYHWGASTQCVFDKIQTREASYTKHAMFFLSLWCITSFDGILRTARQFWPNMWCLQIVEIVVAAIQTTLILATRFANRVFLGFEDSGLRKSIGYTLLAPLMVIFWITFVLYEIYCSINFDLLKSFVGLSLTTAIVTRTRNFAQEYYLEGDEDKWRFGQILPMLMFALPLFQTIEVIFGKYLPSCFGRGSIITHFYFRK